MAPPGRGRTGRLRLGVGTVWIVASAWILVEFGGLRWMQGTAGRRDFVGLGLLSWIVFPKIVDDRLNDGWCFRWFLAHGYTSFLPAILGGGAGATVAAAPEVDEKGRNRPVRNRSSGIYCFEHVL